MITEAALMEWERARYARFVEIQMDYEFPQAIRLLNQELPGLRDQALLQSEAKATRGGRPRLNFCKHGHDLSLTRAFTPDGRANGCRECRVNRRRAPRERVS